MTNSKLYMYPHGDITQLFGMNPTLYSAVSDLRIKGHNGWDIARPYGTPVLAVCDGYIADVKDSPDGYGRHIRLISNKQDDGSYYEITYGHLSEIKVSIGQRVTRGNVIGNCGNSGFVVSGGTPYWGGANPDNRGTHLHLTIRRLTDLANLYNPAPLLYPGDKYGYNVEDYTNGFSGAIDPAPFFEDEIVGQAKSVIELAKALIARVVQFLIAYKK